MKKWGIKKSFRGLFLVFLYGGLILLSIQNLYSQNVGFKYLHNYSFKDESYAPQNWIVDQDSRGLIYVANGDAILVFDGVSWDVIISPRIKVLSLAVDDDGTIYAGGVGEIGYFTPDSKGTWQFVSLMDQLKEDQKEFSYVMRIYCVKDKVYFYNVYTPQLLICWDKKKKKMKVWKPGSYFIQASQCREEMFVCDWESGMMKVEDDLLTPIPHGKDLAGKLINMMVPYDDEKILIGTQSQGFYLYNEEKVIPFPTGADEYLKEKIVLSGIRLSSPKTGPREFAVATMRGGLVIFDSNGILKYIVNETQGLQNNHVRDVFEDSYGTLWLALDIGVARIEYSSPFDIYDKRCNLPGMVMSVTNHPDGLFAATTKGLYFLSSSVSHQFQPIPGITRMCNFVLSVGDSVLAAGDDGIFQLQGHTPYTPHQLLENPSVVLYRSERDPNRIWAGLEPVGLVSLYFNPKNGQWGLEKKYESIKTGFWTMVEDKNGSLWLGSLVKGTSKVDFPGGIHQPVVTHYSTAQGLPDGNIRVYKAAGHVIFCTHKGIFRFDKNNNMFVPDRTFGDEFAGSGSPIAQIVVDKNNCLWLSTRKRILKAVPQAGGSFALHSTPFYRIPYAFVNSIYPDPHEGAVWFCIEGLVRYNTRVEKNYQHLFPALIRKVQSIDEKFLVFGGYKANTPNHSKPLFPELEYKYRNLHIEFAAPFFEDETHTTYQYFLQGRDRGWSAWASQTRVDYPDLGPGSYTFRVRAKNIYGHLSHEDVFSFKILPPWYRTWWAFLGYALGFFLVIYLAVKWRSGKLEKDKHRLEQVIKDRTKEINEKNQQLKELDQMKSRFFANISHEFRTPLTLIMGPLEQILADYPDGELQKNARMMLRSSQRLLNLVNQLLELAKLDSGKMKLQTSRQDILPFLKSLVASFESLAIQQRLELIFQTDLGDLSFYFDPEKLEKIIFNLLSNAVKFTPVGGKITVSLQRDPGRDENFPAGAAIISVKDTGKGIPAGQLPHIFDRFHQAGDSYEHKQKGSGIGLALTKELVTLHHGEILVRSQTDTQEEGGTEFILRLPLGDRYLKPEEIVEEPYQISPPQEPSWEIAPDTTAASEEEEETGEKNVILVVEDNGDMRNYIRAALEPVYHVLEAVDGKEGMEKARTVVPDLIISDIMMPEADGYELCNTLKKDINTSHIPVILLTAKASQENIIQGLETGADDYITKPFNTQILTARIKNLIDLRRQLQLKRIRQMTLQPAEISVSSIDEKFYSELQNMIEKNLADMEFNVEQLCKRLYIGRTSLYRKILALTGETPSQFMRSYRLQRAAQLLKAKYGNVTEVAFAVGFSNTAYFTKCFKEKFHQLPSTFQSSQTSGALH